MHVFGLVGGLLLRFQLIVRNMMRMLDIGNRDASRGSSGRDILFGMCGCHGIVEEVVVIWVVAVLF